MTHPLVLWCRASGLPEPEQEVRFAPPRRWRFDHCWKAQGVALEVQGGLFTGGRHARGPALLREHEKLNAAAAAGFRVLFATPQTLLSDETLRALQMALKQESPPHG